MKRFFAIIFGLVLIASASSGAAASSRQVRSNTSHGADVAVVAVFRALRFLIGLVPAGDGLIPPLPRPAGQTKCCK